MTRFFVGVTVVCCGAASLAAPPLPVAAQEELRRTVTPTPRNGATASSLPQVLDQANWDARERGPLLVVDPQNTPRFFPRHLPGQTFVPPAPFPEPSARGGYRFAAVAEFFARKIVPTGSVSVLAPTTMQVLNTHPGDPDLLGGMDPRQKMSLLQKTLTQAQWRKVGGASGLGASDLDAAQRAILLSLLPDPFVIEQIVYGPEGRWMGPSKRRTLTPAERAAVRVRLARRLSWSFPQGKGGWVSIGVDSPRAEGATTLEIPYDTAFRGFEPRDVAFGVSLKSEVPSRLKPGDLFFAAPALNNRVVLPPQTTVGELVKAVAAQTGVELYADVRHASRLVVVKGEGGGAFSGRAGDVLQALCWAVSGTFRRVGPANGRPVFVMTDDRIGLGTRHARIKAWASQAQAAKGSLEKRLAARVEPQDPAAFVDWNANDPLAPDDDLRQKIDAHRAAPAVQERRGNEFFVPVSTLPPAAQAMVRQQLESHQQSQQNQPPRPAGFPEQFEEPLITDQVRLDVQLNLGYVVPGVGEVVISGSYSSSDNSLLRRRGGQRAPAASPTRPRADVTDRVTLPPAVATRALLIAPRTGDEAARAARAARSRGLNQLWVIVDGDSAAPKSLLADAVAAGKENQIAVLAVVRLLRLSDTDAAEKSADRNILGETTTEYARRRLAGPIASDELVIPGAAEWETRRLRQLFSWRRIDTDEAKSALTQSVLAVAATPGLAGLVLRDAAAPGYDAEAGGRRLVIYYGNGYYGGGMNRDAEDLGYTDPMRLAFLRKHGLDPVDLSPTGDQFSTGDGGLGSSVDLRLSFFADYGPDAGRTRINDRPVTDLGAKNGAGAWDEFRRDVDAAFLAALHRAVRAAHPNLALFLRNRKSDVPDGAANWYGVWEKPDELPVKSTGRPGGSGAGSGAKHRLLVSVASAAESATTASLAARLGTYLKRETGESGLVLDLSDRPVDDALPLLDAIAP